MKITQKLAVGVLSLVTIFSFATTSVMANDNPKAGKRPGLLQKLFDLRGKAAIGNGTVKSIGSDSLVVTDEDGTDHTVQIDSKTKFRRRFWGGGSLSEIQVGDTVNVIGRWTDSTRITIKAVLVRDLSIQQRFGVFFGNVDSLTTDGWVMKTVKRGDETVSVSSDTKLVNREGETITQADVKVGDKVRVRGLWDKTNSTITEVKEVKDFSLPQK